MKIPGGTMHYKLYTNTVKWNRRLVCLWSKMSTFSTDFLPAKNVGLPMPTLLFNTICESFQMRYCMTLYLKGHQKYDRSKLKVQLLLSKFRLFNFDLSYFWYLLRYRVIQYLIWKLSDMVKMRKKGLLVAAFLASVRMS